MPVVNCTPRIADVRALRAAAFLPLVTGLTLLVVAAPLSWLVDHDSREAAGFLGGSIALLLASALIKRGEFIAALVLAAALVAIVFGMLLTIGNEARRRDALEIVLTCAGTSGLCWLAVRAVIASWRLRRVPWQSRSAATMWMAIAQLPRDHRLAASVEPLVSAFGVYGIGLCVALLVGIATTIGLLAGLAFLPFALAASRLMQRARQTLALRMPEVRARDRRPPVLLVRSFADDMLGLEARFEYFGRLLRKRLTLEEFVAGRMMNLGPVVAIGKPNEGLSPLGAAREYVFGPGWQERVSSLLDESSWVIGILGGTEGLRWEYEQILHRSLTHRLIVVVPPATPEVFQERWAIFRKAFPPAAGADVALALQMGGPLCVLFPEGGEPLLFCSKYRNETAYSVVFAMLFAALAKSREIES
jgi:hypothetical protein